jgi:hypothetical protein
MSRRRKTFNERYDFLTHSSWGSRVHSEGSPNNFEEARYEPKRTTTRSGKSQALKYVVSESEKVKIKNANCTTGSTAQIVKVGLL